MTSNNTGAFFLSTLMHAVVAGLVLFFTYAVNEPVKDAPKVLELVAGEGDNYMATEAPALGVPNAPKVAMPDIPSPPPGPIEPDPAPPEPVRAPPEPVRAAPEPVIERAPEKAEKPKPQPDAIRDFSKDVKRIASKREKRLEQKYRKEREAAERKEREAELRSRRMTKEEFDRQNKSTAKGGGGGRGSTKVARIDTEGIVGGVVGGSTRNKTGGAGGKALTREEGEVLDAYFSLLKRRLHEALDKPPGLADTLVAEVEFYLGADGSLSRGRIISSSGSQEFDQAALEAIVHVRSIGPRPDRKGESVRIKFRMREEDE